MRTRVWATGLALVFALASAGCASATPDESVVGAWGDTEVKDKPSLEFKGTADSGDYSGTDGCNVVGGKYTVESGKIDLGIMRSTLMFCEGVDTWLSQAQTATLAGDTLTLFDEAGAEIGTLSR